MAEKLLADGHAFRCCCSRKQIQATGPGGRYPGTCRTRGIRDPDTAVRVMAPEAAVVFDDLLQGRQTIDIAHGDGDYVVYRRGGLPAYHLAVVLDDAASGVTDVVRGIDLLEQTGIHLHLQALLGLPTPRYWHVPIVTDATGQKLSKQTGARGIDPNADAGEVAMKILAALGVTPPPELRGERPATLWRWAASIWSIDRHRAQRSIPFTGN